MTREKSLWQLQTERNPGHSDWFIQRFKTMEAEGKDIWGEARVADAMVPRGAKILDAGSGSGRIGGYLHRAGHDVTGVDIDPILVAESQRVYPEATWIAADLTDLADVVDIADAETQGFDLVVSGGNVMPFLAPSTRVPVLENIRAVLKPGARAVIGFGAGRGYEFTDFLDDAKAAGLSVANLYSTWELHPFTEESGFLVAVLSK